MLAIKPPLVSILLPTLNGREFLEERVASILNQTFQDWELIIADSYSDDGTWEYLNEIQKKKYRISMYQIPKGLYQAWNFCLSKAQGTYVYIATADDSMRLDCIEKMVDALETHPECGICDSVLKLIDSEGNEIKESSDSFVAHYWHFDFPRDQKHIRNKPHDYFLHLGGKTVYTSITQILIRKSLFAKAGIFPTDCGCSADFQWGMRAALNTNIVFLPEKLASWRIHFKQATSSTDAEQINRNFSLMLKMAEQCISELKDPLIKKESKKLIQLMYFKAKLLPAKRESDIRLLLYYVLRTFFQHPFMLMEFFCRALKFYGKGKRNLWLIRTYDSMILSRICKMKLPHLICLEK